MTRKAEPAAVADLLARVRRTIERYDMLKGGETVVVAVSGGPDSLALLHVLDRLAPVLDVRLHVAHFDHRLRADSAEDAVFVRRQAERLGHAFTLGVADDTETPRGKSPEEAARDRRYAFLRDVAAQAGANRVALGHTLDDQAETVLMHLLTGAGRAGLGGMKPVRWRWIRPLIDVRRSQVEAFCRAARLRPRIDATNEDPAFLRNVIRRDVIPQLRASVNDRLIEALARTADVIRDEDHYLDAVAAKLASPEATTEDCRIAIDVLRDMPRALQRRAIRLLARTVGDGIGFEHTEAVRDLALTAREGQRIDLSGGLSARVEYGFIVVGRASPPTGPRDPIELVVPGETDLVPWGRRVRTWITSDAPVEMPDGSQMCVLDADRAAFPLRVRRWRTGDRFRPLGMSRQKKVGDFFTDAKVARAQRQEVPLVVGDDGSIMWVIGHRIDDRVKVSPETARFLWLAVEEAT